jgi:hypothetical protein
VVGVVVFCLIAVASVASPVLAYAVAQDRMRHPLDELSTWAPPLGPLGYRGQRLGTRQEIVPQRGVFAA